MRTTKSFDARIGAVRLPEATDAIGETEEERALAETRISAAADHESIQPFPRPFDPPGIPFPRWRLCRTVLKEGCFTLSFRPQRSGPLGPSFRGTLRVQRVENRYVISGDLYRRRFLIPFPPRPELPSPFPAPDLDVAADTKGVIPIFRRRHYHSYLKGTGARLFHFVPFNSPCRFTIDFDEFVYQHPASGFDGTFPAAPTRSIRFELNHAGASDLYNGKAFEGSAEIGTVSIRWISSFFRRATLEVHTLQGAEAPPTSVPGAGGSESFRTVFETAGWDLTENFVAAPLPLPASLAGVQDPGDCWPSQNSAALMESIPGYDPSELDSVWKARLIAIPAQLGCSRGRMFDNGAGDPNNVDREGAVTHSHDGYPAGDGVDYGAALNQQQKDVPRAFLRSAAHEVGHTFNQIHQFFESGSDNSIMTVTPSVAQVLDTGGGTFPDDIHLGFNDTVRQHLVHLPDPAVRPGAMEFFGAAINAPQASDVNVLDDLELVLETDTDTLRLGESLTLKWKLRNTGDVPVPVPGELGVESLTARVSVTDPRGAITFLRPVQIEACPHVPIDWLEADQEVGGETTVFYGRDGFAFEQPGRHTVEVIVLWAVQGAHCAVSGEKEVWVTHPLTDEDNRIAALLLDAEVGKAVALGDASFSTNAADRIAEAARLQKSHPACKRLADRGLVKRSSARRPAAKKRRAKKTDKKR